MTLRAYTLRPSFRAALLTFLIHQNPFYLLSALSMLAGCYALNSGLGTRAGDLGKLLALIGVLNCYEAMLIALGLFLIRQRGILRDGRTLLLLEAPFLVDLAFLNAEIGSSSARIGCLLNLLVLFLALVKTAVVLHALWGRIPRRLFAFLALELSVLFLLPSAFKHFEHNGYLTSGQFYMAWWVVGALMVIYELQCRFGGTDSPQADSGLRLFIRRLYLVLPLASIVLHLCMLHWVYRVAWTMGDIAPLLLGGTFILGRSTHAERGDVRLLRALMPLAAIVLTIQHEPNWSWQLGTRLNLTPVLLTVAVGYIAYVYSFFLKHAARLLAGGIAVVAFALFGPTFQQTLVAISWAAERIWGLLQWLARRSAVEWGIAAMGCAFALLAMGASISLRKDGPASGP